MRPHSSLHYNYWETMQEMKVGGGKQRWAEELVGGDTLGSRKVKAKDGSVLGVRNSEGARSSTLAAPF